MKDINKVQVRYLYRHEWKEKYVTLSQIAEWTRSGKYQSRVDAARGRRETPMEGGMVCGPMAADELPMVMPARGAEASYTGLVLLSLRVDEGDALGHGGGGGIFALTQFFEELGGVVEEA